MKGHLMKKFKTGRAFHCCEIGFDISKMQVALISILPYT